MKPDLAKINIMGIINTTPDSFSDGGLYADSKRAIEHARQLIEEGVDILDIGGESTRPGASKVSLEEELHRTIPVIKAIREFSDIPLSIDTSKAKVMQAAAHAGADIINDVRALQQPGSLSAAAESGLMVCLMHMQGAPDSMQDNPVYEDVVDEVKQFLAERIRIAEEAGIKQSDIIIDPGFGFGKTLQQNLQILARLDEFRALGYPLLVGLSRKSMLGLLLDQPVDKRLHGSLSAAVISALSGANIIRVHDVQQTKEVLTIVQAVLQQSNQKNKK